MFCHESIVFSESRVGSAIDYLISMAINFILVLIQKDTQIFSFQFLLYCTSMCRRIAFFLSARKKKQLMQNCIFVCCSFCRTETFLTLVYLHLTGSAISTCRHTHKLVLQLSQVFILLLFRTFQPLGHSLHIPGLLNDHVTTSSGFLLSCLTMVPWIIVISHFYLCNLL